MVHLSETVDRHSARHLGAAVGTGNSGSHGAREGAIGRCDRVSEGGKRELACRRVFAGVCEVVGAQWVPIVASGTGNQGVCLPPAIDETLKADALCRSSGGE